MPLTEITRALLHQRLAAFGAAAVIGHASFLPAGAAYSAADVVDVPKEFVFADASGNVVPAGALIRMVSAEIKIDETALISGEAAYTLQLYSVTPPSALADNAAWTLASADLPSYRGGLSLGTPVDLGAAAYVKTQFSDQQDFNLASGKASLWGSLVTVGGVTFTAVARQIFLYGFVV